MRVGIDRKLVSARAFLRSDTEWFTHPFDRDDLSALLTRRRDFYRTLKVSKNGGRGHRYLSVPDGDLAAAQRNVLRNTLSNSDLYHSRAFAYIPGRSATACAREHEGARWLIKLDIQDFFHSVDERRIAQEFRRRNLTRYQAFGFARFFTRVTADWQPWQPDKYREVQDHSRLAKKNDVKIRRLGFLPQGAPASGAISNLVAFDMDNLLNELARKNDLVYTRYADDMYLSGKSPFNRDYATQILRQALRIVWKQGFHVNGDKTRIVPPGARKQVLGLLVDSPGLRLPPTTKHQVERDIWAIGKFGLANHVQRIRNQNSDEFVKSLDGLLSWAMDVEPTWATHEKQQLRAALGNVPAPTLGVAIKDVDPDLLDPDFGQSFDFRPKW